MAIKSRADLKSIYVPGAETTQQDFADWADSYLHTTDNLPAAGVLAGIAAASAGNLKAAFNGAHHVCSGHEIIVDANAAEATDNRTNLSKYSRNAPFKTFTAALATATAGDIVRGMPGMYSENCTTSASWAVVIIENCSIYPANAGLPVFNAPGGLVIMGNENTYLGSDGPAPVIQAASVNLYNMNIDAGSHAVVVTGGGVPFIADRCSIRSFSDALVCGFGEVRISNTNIIADGGYGIRNSNMTSLITCSNTRIYSSKTCIENICGSVEIDNSRFYSITGHGVRGKNLLTVLSSVKNSYFNTFKEAIFQQTDGVHCSNIEVLDCVCNVRDTSVTNAISFTGDVAAPDLPFVYGNKFNKSTFTIVSGGGPAPAGNNIFNIPMAADFPLISNRL